jgi:nucleotide-binding universal stress UspA family protein
MFQKILIAIDGKTCIDRVFTDGLALAKATEASLMLLRVLSPQDEEAPFAPASDSIYDVQHTQGIQSYLEQWQTYEKSGFELLKALAAQADQEGISAEFSLNRGEPGRVICDLASSWNADLILIAGREPSGLKGLLLGSVSNYVTHHAPCSVLIVQ